MEQLLETLVAKITSFEEEVKIMTPKSIGTDDILPPDSATTSCNHNIQETAPFLALFDNTAVSTSPLQLSKLIYLLTFISLDVENSTHHKLQHPPLNLRHQSPIHLEVAGYLKLRESEKLYLICSRPRTILISSTKRPRFGYTYLLSLSMVMIW